MADRGPIRITAVGVTDVGRVRGHNEDNLLAADLSAEERLEAGKVHARELGEHGFILAVADGMGGSASGETASEMAVETLFESLSAKRIAESGRDRADPPAAVADCLKIANERILAKSQQEPRHRGMGTTMTAVLALGDKLAIAQVGDSRAYLMREGSLAQITRDQSLISQLVDEGTLAPDEAEHLVGKNVILQALGVKSELDVDTGMIELCAGDVVLLCSDGLSGMLKDGEMEAVLSAEPDLVAAGSRLVEMANAAGGHDNITVVLARFEGPGLRAPDGPLKEPLKETHKADGEERRAPRRGTARSSKLRLGVLLGVAFAAAAALVFSLFFAGRRVTFEFPAPGAVASLRPARGGDEIVIEVPPQERAGTVKSLPPGEYLLSAELEGYEPLRDRAIRISRGTESFEVPLVGRPASLRLVPTTPYVRVTIEKAERKDWEPAYRNEEIAVGTGARTVSGVPAGAVVIRVMRDGYRQAEPLRIDVPAAASEFAVELPALAPLVGMIELEGPPGAAVSVLYRDGDAYTNEIPASGRMTGEVRAGTHVLEIRHPRYETYTERVVVHEGKTTRIPDPKLEPRTGTLLVRGPYGGVLFLKSLSEGGTVTRGLIGAQGAYRFDSLPPGEYLLRFETPWDEPVERAVTVVSGREDTLKIQMNGGSGP